MQKNKEKKQKVIAKIFVALVISSAAGFSLWKIGKAQSESIEQLPQQTTDAETQAKIEELEKRAKVYREIIDIKKQQSETLNNQISLMDSNIAQKETEIEINKQKIEDLNAQIERLQRQIQEKEQSMQAERAVLTNLVQIYYTYTKQDLASLFLSNENMASFMLKKDRLSQTEDKIKSIISDLKNDKATFEQQTKDLQEKKEEIAKVHDALLEQSSYLDTIRDQKKDLLDKTKGEEERYQQLLTKTKQQIEEEIEKMEFQKSGIDLGPLPASKPGMFIYPVNPVVITQGYGKTSFSNNYASGKHNGIDFSIDYKSIYAAGNGKVIQVGDNGKYAYGKWVAISHGNGLVTLYSHFSKIIVDKGDTVKTGDVLGISGNTGFSTGPHLHFSVFVEKTFELVESKVVKGLMLPIGASLNPKNYL